MHLNMDTMKYIPNALVLSYKGRSMKKLLLVLGLTLVLMGCLPVKGTLTVSDTVVLVANNGRAFSLSPGIYQTSLRLNKKKKRVELKINLSQDQRKDEDLNEFNDEEEDDFEFDQRLFFFKTGNNGVPTYNGPIDLPASVSGQNVHLKGYVKTKRWTTGPFSGYEYCTYIIEEYVCKKVRTDHGHHDRHCHYEDVSQSGQQHVEYMVNHVTIDATLTLSDAMKDSGSTMATFLGARSYSDNRYLHIGICY